MKEDEEIDMLMKSKKVKALVESRRSLNVTTWWLVRLQIDARSELARDYSNAQSMSPMDCQATSGQDVA